MAYSFVPLGSSGQDYDEMASTVDKMLYFAGEVSVPVYSLMSSKINVIYSHFKKGVNGD